MVVEPEVLDIVLNVQGEISADYRSLACFLQDYVTVAWHIAVSSVCLVVCVESALSCRVPVCCYAVSWSIGGRYVRSWTVHRTLWTCTLVKRPCVLGYYECVVAYEVIAIFGCTVNVE